MPVAEIRPSYTKILLLLSDWIASKLWRSITRTHQEASDAAAVSSTLWFAHTPHGVEWGSMLRWESIPNEACMTQWASNACTDACESSARCCDRTQNSWLAHIFIGNGFWCGDSIQGTNAMGERFFYPFQSIFHYVLFLAAKHSPPSSCN